MAERSRDAVAGVLVGSILVSLVIQRHTPGYLLMIWVGMFLVVNGYRTLLCRQLLEGKRPMTEAVLRQFFGIALANGLWLGALSIGFFTLLPLESRLALTVLILLAVAGGAATFASYAPGYIVFVALAITPAAYEWQKVGGESGLTIAVTLVIFGFTMAGFSRYLVGVFEHSVEIRFEREAVVQQLRIEQGLNEVERKKAEDASAAKTRFLANASHDLRQPAQALALYTAVLQRTAVTEEQRELASSISQASLALGGLLNNLLDLSRLDAGAVTVRYERVDLRRLIFRLANDSGQVGAARGTTVQCSCAPLTVFTDPVIIERTLRNLLHNALKFTEGGMVTITVEHDSANIRVRVHDTGCGIAAQYHDRVFDEFFQVANDERDREKGLGLGLSIVARLARLLEGRVLIQSEVDVGSTFTLEFPNAMPTEHVRDSALGALSHESVLADLSVLVIDDDPMVRNALQRLLRDWGANVDAVAGLCEALPLAKIKRWKLCLCDLRLKGNEDGLTTAVALREIQPDLPIIFISGDTAPERIERATKSGHPLLHKPVDPEELAEQITQTLSASGTT